MATPSSSTPPPQKNRHIKSTISISISLLFVFLLVLFLFSKRSLDHKLSVYRDLFITHPLLRSASASAAYNLTNSTYNKGLNISPPISSKSNLDDQNSAFIQIPNSASSDSGGENSKDSRGATAVDGEANGKAAELVDINESHETKNEWAAKSTNSPSDDTNDKGMQENETASSTTNDQVAALLQSCDLYQGTWVKDEEYPLYSPGSCPYVDEAFDCQNNGRPDSEYVKWRWKPDGCDLPRFNATDFLVRLRGKKLLLVGDSVNRNQFESLLCLLREGLQNKSRMYEVRGHKITKGRGQFTFKFEDYDCSVDFVRSHFLVKEGIRISGRGSSNPTLSIDIIDKSSKRWKRADILVFNTGHWWTHGKTSRGKNYYKEGDYLYPQLDSVEAYRRALKTWGKWIDHNISPRSLVFYRGYSSAHFRGGDWDSGGSCNGETEPVLNGSIINNYPLKMKIVEEVIQEMRVPAVLLNVTRLTNFRKDGHPSMYGKHVKDGIKVSRKKQDCSHWCLPGVPDAWNELIYATLVAKQTHLANQ